MADSSFPLKLGSHGQKVRDAQWLLTGHNVFKIHALKPGKKIAHHHFSNIDGKFGQATAKATERAKFLCGYPEAECDQKFGRELRAYLLGDKPLPAPFKKRRISRVAAEARKFFYPLGKHGPYIGYPGQGTHSWTEPPNNWESDNAVDISIPVGTPIIAYADGTIGPSFGPLDSSNPRFAGLRLHLVTASNELYYAHLSTFARGLSPGDHVKAGQVLGKSGSANGAAHLHLGFREGSPLDLLKGTMNPPYGREIA